jgi:hypothetical protein
MGLTHFINSINEGLREERGGGRRMRRNNKVEVMQL